MNLSAKISRRDFLKLGAIGAGSLFLKPGQRWPVFLPDFPDAPLLGRVCQGKVEIKAKPNMDSETVGVLYDDGVVPWLKEVIGVAPKYKTNHRWVETSNGYIYAPFLQKVKNLPNEPLSALPDNPSGKGMWAEVTVPYVDISLANPPGRAPKLQDWATPRFYYSQIFWIDEISTNSQGEVIYRAVEKYGSYGDIFWVDAKAFKPLAAEDIAPIRPEVEDKKVVINVSNQTMACYEGGREIYYCRVSTGAKYDAEGNPVEKWSTPVSPNHHVNRKWISIHMAGGSAAAGYELFGISWTSIFATGGVAIHSTYWHNNYGEPMSHGCVNAMPEDAKFIFQWTMPETPYDPGFVEISGFNGTSVEVAEMS